MSQHGSGKTRAPSADLTGPAGGAFCVFLAEDEREDLSDLFLGSSAVSWLRTEVQNKSRYVRTLDRYISSLSSTEALILVSKIQSSGLG